MAPRRGTVAPPARTVTCSTTPSPTAHSNIRSTGTIVTFAAPGDEVPFVASVVDCGGTSVKGNIINCPPDPEHIKLGMSVRLATTSMGTDDHGVEAVNFGFEPA